MNTAGNIDGIVAAKEALPPKQTRTAQLAEFLRRTPVYQALIPLEAGIGFPVPCVGNDGRVFLTFPLIGQARQAGQLSTGQHQTGQLQTREEGTLTVLFPPLAEMTLDWKNGRIVSYRDYHYDNPFGDVTWNVPVGAFPHSGIADLSRQEYAHEVEALYRHYDELLNSLALEAELPPYKLREFGQQLKKLMVPGLLPYYRALAPRFMTMLLPEEALSEEALSEEVPEDA